MQGEIDILAGLLYAAAVGVFISAVLQGNGIHPIAFGAALMFIGVLIDMHGKIRDHE